MVSRQNNEEKEMEEVKGHGETSVIGNSMSEWIYNSATMTAPIVSADLIKGIVVKFQDADSSLWKNAKIYRNGIHTTVKWGDGTITRVKLTEGEEGNDVDAFLNALGKKLFGSRTALKKFVEQNTVDVAHKKDDKKSSRRWKNDRKRRKNGEVIARDSNGVELKAGDTVYIKTYSDIDWGGKIYRIDKTGDCTVMIGEHIVPSECFTKVRTEPPYSVGDWVVFRNPKENYLVHSEAWTSHMVADKPLRIEKINGINLLCDDGCVYESLWVRGLDT